MGTKGMNRNLDNMTILKRKSNGKPLPKLSKSRFIRGLQCHKALWLDCYRYNDRDPISEEQKKIFTQGNDIGLQAWNLYPGGENIYEGWQQPDQAIQHTLDAMKNKDTIYEAAFKYNDIVVRVDIFRKGKKGWRILEVKSTKSIKPVIVRDVGIQQFVLSQCGVPLEDSSVIHMSPEYNYDNPDFSDVRKAFVEKDITEQAQEFADEIPNLLGDMRLVLRNDKKVPEIEPGEQCLSPYRCPFYGTCHPDK